MANTEDVPLGISYIITIIINSVACPFTVLLNVLVIKVVMMRPRLRTNSNILLACLAVTDVLTGLFGQPSHVLWRIFLISGLSTSEKVEDFHFNVMFILATALCLHLILVSFERLVAIKFTMQYPNVITDSNLKIAVSTLSATGLYGICPINDSLWQTCILLNSLVNPLIYCWRQKEMRKFLFRIRTQVVHPATQ
ncbi:uncharacterized protein LOC111333190 [Stylophora pistillata]|uniref:uncharacterized protein LOC111333190 n=1 Tax=Stylophora pistillata TaxID=50429 RepID=UPI000C03B214|nr:uncharacterized protein LOC111333190 [Stylophora pistillata]